MTTTNSSWFTTTKEEFQEAPYHSINSAECIPFSVTIADGAMDADGDIVNLVLLPQTVKLLAIYYELEDHDDGGESDMDFNLIQISDGTTTSTALYAPGSLGQAAVTGDWILPAVGSSFLAELVPTDSGTAKIILEQNAAVTTDKATTVKGLVFYR